MFDPKLGRVGQGAGDGDHPDTVFPRVRNAFGGVPQELGENPPTPTKGTRAKLFSFACDDARSPAADVGTGAGAHPARPHGTEQLALCDASSATTPRIATCGLSVSPRENVGHHHLVIRRQDEREGTRQCGLHDLEQRLHMPSQGAPHTGGDVRGLPPFPPSSIGAVAVTPRAETRTSISFHSRMSGSEEQGTSLASVQRVASRIRRNTT